MEVAITGASGLVGSAVASSLAEDGHRVRRLVRSPGDAADDRDAIFWDPADGNLNPEHLEGIGAVVNLAGAGIGDRRWSEARKKVILESRVRATDLLARTLAALDDPPAVLVSASAVGYYGDKGDQVVTEASDPGSGFLTDVTASWEAATTPAEAAGIRVVHLRSAAVLSRAGGLLPRLLLPFRLGLGGRMGPGTQWLSWISLEDEVRAVRFLLESAVSGPVNAAAPGPVPNRELARALGRAVHRPAAIPTPVRVIGLALGRQLVQELMLDSQRVQPAVLEEAGFTFRHPDIDTALAAVMGR